MRELPGQALPTFVFADRAEAERVLADEIEALVAARPGAVLGLPTGDTPRGFYAELARRCREGRFSLRQATTFNLDEYLGLAPDDPRCFRAWMERELFAHVDLDRARAHLPDAGAADPDAEAARYERAIRSAGGLDLLVLGIGRNGHVGFNEPGSARDSRTRVVDLHPWTREDAAASFGGLDRVPRRAITMGVATILDVRRLRVLAFGARKAEVVRAALDAERGPVVPATWLRDHQDVRLYLDQAAAAAVS